MCLIDLYAFIEKRIIDKKKKYCKKRYESFLNRFDLLDGARGEAACAGYNPYEGTYINLCESLVKSKQISIHDSILDVGCGAGIFLAFLYIHGFQNLYGIEINEKLFATAVINREILKNKRLNNAGDIVLVNSDIFLTTIEDCINVFYLFNTFSDEEKYLSFFSLIKESLDRKNRKIKIIFLFLTEYSRSALKKTTWLQKKDIIRDTKQYCSDCLKYYIYEN